ncbi:MAG: hypothetical protein ACHQRO_11990, partial [Vicinamibacteria bacterium]
MRVDGRRELVNLSVDPQDAIAEAIAEVGHADDVAMIVDVEGVAGAGGSRGGVQPDADHPDEGGGS